MLAGAESFEIIYQRLIVDRIEATRLVIWCLTIFMDIIEICFNIDTVS